MAEMETIPPVEEVKQEPTGPTETEQRAMDSGWVPKDQWEGDPEQWRPAKEFLDRGDLFKKIDDQNRTVKELKRALDDMKAHHSKVRETEYAHALATLKAQKQVALEEGDAAKVIQLEDKIDLVKDEQKSLRAEPAQSQEAQVAPEFTEWTNRNKWYENNQPMRAYADALGRDLAYKGLAPKEVLKEVERQVKMEFPNKFTNPNRDKPGAVEGSSNKGGKSSDGFQLSDDERRVMQRFVRSGVMTEAEYIKDLKSVRG